MTAAAIQDARADILLQDCHTYRSEQPGLPLCCHAFLPRSPAPSRGSAPQSAAGARRPHAGLCRPGGGPAAPQSLASPLPPGAVLNMSKITSILCFLPPPRSHAQTRSAGPPRGYPCLGQCGEGRALRRERTGPSREDAVAGLWGLRRYHGQGSPRSARPVSRTRLVLSGLGRYPRLAPGSPRDAAVARRRRRPRPQAAHVRGGGRGGASPSRY